jgi:phage-related protein
VPAIGERFEFEFDGDTRAVNAKMAVTERQAASLERQAHATDRALDDLGGASAGAAPKVRGLGDGLADTGRKADRSSKGIKGLDSAARDLDRALSVLKLPAVAAGAVGLTNAAIGASGAIGALGAALVPVTGAVAALPSLFLSGGQAMGVARLATAGFGDALKALNTGNPKKIAEAMKGLGAEAQETARRVHGLNPEFDRLRVIAQTPIFGAINANFSRLTGLLPIVRQGIQSTAGVMGSLIDQGARMVTSGPWQASFRTIIAANTNMIRAFGQGGLALLDVFRMVTVAGLPLAQSFANLFRNAAQATQGFLASERGARALAGFLRMTESVLVDLGRILVGVGVILVNVFRPGISLGTGMLDTLAKLTSQAARWTQSMQGQDRIRAIWADVRNILSTMGPILTSMATAAGRFLTVALAIGRWFADLQRAHPVLADIVGNFLALAAIARFTGISSLVGSVGALVGNVAALKAFGGIFTGMAGVFTRLGGVLAGVWPLLVRLSGAFSLIVGPAAKFGGILRFLIPGIGMLASPIGLAVAAVALLAGGVFLLWKRFGSFGAIVKAFQGWISNTLVPAVMRFRDAIMVQWGKAVAYVQSIMPQLQEAIGHVLAVIRVVVGAWVGWMKTVWRLLGDDLLRIIKAVWQTIGGVISGAVKVIQGIIQVVLAAINGDWSRVWGGLGKIVQGAWQVIWSIVRGAFNVLKSLVGAGLSAIPLLFIGLFSKLGPLVTKGIGALVRYIGQMPAMSVRALSSLGRLLGDLITKAWQGFQNISVRLVSAFMAWASKIPGRMVTAIQQFGSFIVNKVLIPGWGFWRTTFTRLWTAFINWAKNFPQWMVNAIKDFGRFIVNKVLIPAWTSWRNTSTTAWSRFITWARGIPQSMVNAIIPIVARMRTVIANAFSAVMTRAKQGWASIRSWATGIPGSMATAIGGLGNRIASVFSSAFQRAKNILGSFYNNVVKKVAGFFGVKLPSFAVGGIVDTTNDRRPVRGAFAAGGEIGPGGQPVNRARGGAVPLTRGRKGKDSVNIRATPGEYVMTPEMVKAFPGGIRSLERWRTYSNARAGARQRIRSAGGNTPGEAHGGPLAVGGRISGLVPSFLAALRAYSSGIGRNINVTSGFRTRAQQAALYRQKPGLAAPPGRSNHEKGLAADITPQMGGTRLGNPTSQRYGLRYPMSYEPWHIEPTNLSGGASGGGGPGILAGLARKAINLLWKPVGGLLSRIAGNSALGQIVMGAGHRIKDAMLSWVDGQDTGGIAGGPGGGAPAANAALGKRLAAAYGWGSGAQWNALNALVMSESGWNNNAQNPTSTAYGIGQFLNSTWAGVGATKTSNPTAQIQAMLRYIKQRYGSATAAWSFKRSHNWYGQGGPVQAMAAGGPVGYASGGFVEPNVYGTTFAEFTGRTHRKPGSAPVVANAMLAGQLQKAFAERAKLVMGAGSVQKNLAMRWYRAPARGVSREAFYMADVRDPNRGKSGYIQSSRGSWVKGSRHQISWRTNLWNHYKKRGLTKRLMSYYPGRAPAVTAPGGIGPRSVFRPQSGAVPGSKPTGSVNIGNGAVQVSINGAGGVDADMVERVVTNAFRQFAGLIQVRGV